MHGNPLSWVQTVRFFPRTFRRPGFPDEEVCRLRTSLEGFLAHADLSESALIIDGTGPGLASHFVALFLLGPERVLRFRSIHAVCASVYGILAFLARQNGTLSLTREKIDEIYRANQAIHHLDGWSQGVRLVLRFLSGSPYMFPNDLHAEALAYVARPEFQNMRVSELPENLSFLTYCVEDRSVCEIQRESRFADWSMSDVVRSMTALKRIYSPFRKDGKSYMDAVTDRPQLRELFWNIRKRNRHVLFLHMEREGTRGNTTYVKMHNTGFGRIRVALDFLYFLTCSENRDFVEAIRIGLYRTSPI